jgi:hypothetical protein
MKFRVLILAILLTHSVYSQNSSKEPLYIQITCGSGAQTTKEINRFKEEAQLKDSSIIKKKLIEGLEFDQVLSAIILWHYYLNRQVTLSPIEYKKITEISKSKRKFELCFTCTFHEKGTLKDLFNEKKAMCSYTIIKEYLLNKF